MVGEIWWRIELHNVLGYDTDVLHFGRNTCKCSIILATAGMTHQPTAPLSLNTISQILMSDILPYKCTNTTAIPDLLAELIFFSTTL